MFEDAGRLVESKQLRQHFFFVLPGAQDFGDERVDRHDEHFYESAAPCHLRLLHAFSRDGRILRIQSLHLHPKGVLPSAQNAPIQGKRKSYSGGRGQSRFK